MDLSATIENQKIIVPGLSVTTKYDNIITRRNGKISITGNSRLTRYLEKDPTFQGKVSIQKDLSLQDRGFEWVEYGQYKYINEIGFTHIPFHGYGPISGMAPCRKAAALTVKSVVFGHTHEGNWENYFKEGMDHLQQLLNCGCFIDEDADEEWTKGLSKNYWRGIMLLHNYDDMRFDIETWSMSRLKHFYL